MKKGPSKIAVDITNDLAMPTAISAIAIHNPEWWVIAVMISYFFSKILKPYEDRDKEIADWIIANETNLTALIVTSDSFKDAFYIMYDKHIKERNPEKRRIIRNIFLWYVKATEEEKEKFELERLLDINNKITLPEIWVLKNIEEAWETKIYNFSNDWWKTWNHVLSKHKYDNILLIDLAFEILSLGLLSQHIIVPWAWEETLKAEENSAIPIHNQYTLLRLTDIGNKYIKYLRKE